MKTAATERCCAGSRHSAVPINSAGMQKAPVDRDPARPPGLEMHFFRARGVPAELEHIEVLTGENVPVAFEKGAAQMLGQHLERAVIARVIGVNRIVSEPRANEIVLIRVV